MLTGTNFASRFGTAVVRVYLNNFDIKGPSMADIDSYTAQLLFGSDSLGLVEADSAIASVESWIASLTEITPFGLPLPAKSAGTLSFTLPAGFGPSQSAIVLVDGIPSNVVNFS